MNAERGRVLIGPRPRTSGSWCTSRAPSAVAWMSSSTPSAPSSTARRKAAGEFSRACPEAPRCAMTLGRRASVKPLDHHCNALSHPDAHGRESVTAAGTTEGVYQRGENAGPACPERMAQGDRAAVDVHLGRIEAEFSHAGDRLGSKGFVELDEVEVLDAEPHPRQQLPGRRDRAESHHGGIHPGNGASHDAGKWPGAKSPGRLPAHHRECRRPIVDTARGPGRDGAVLEKGRLHLAQRFHGHARARVLVGAECRLATLAVGYADRNELVGEDAAR